MTATIPSTWPSDKLDQNNIIAEIELALIELEILVNVPTIHSETEPTLDELKTVIERDFGLAATLPDYTKVMWWKPTASGVENVLMRIADLPSGGSSGAVFHLVPEMPVFAEVLDYNVLDADTASFQSTGLSLDYEYLIVISTTRSTQAVDLYNAAIRWDDVSSALYNAQILKITRAAVTGANVDGATSTRFQNAGTTLDERSWARNLVILRDYADVVVGRTGLQYSLCGSLAGLTERSALFRGIPVLVTNEIEIIDWEAGSGNWLAGSRFLVIGLGKTGV